MWKLFFTEQLDITKDRYFQERSPATSYPSVTTLGLTTGSCTNYELTANGCHDVYVVVKLLFSTKTRVLKQGNQGNLNTSLGSRGEGLRREATADLSLLTGLERDWHSQSHAASAAQAQELLHQLRYRQR